MAAAVNDLDVLAQSKDGVSSHPHIRILGKAVSLIYKHQSVSIIVQSDKNASAYLGVYLVPTYDSDC